MSLSLSFNEFRFDVRPPANIHLPDFVFEIHDSLKKNQNNHNRDCGDGFVFGGIFTSLYKGQEPRDIDICLHCPELAAYGTRLNELKSMNANSYSARDEINETIEHLISHMFPTTQSVMWDQESLVATQNTNIGPCVQILCHVMTADGVKMVDVMFTERKVMPPEIFARAPICSAAYMFDEQQYCVHKNFEDDIKAWSYRPFCDKQGEGIEKARNKGMTII